MPNDAFKMQLSEFKGLQAQIAAFSQNDVQLGRLLGEMFLHLAHLHGFNPAQVLADEQAQARALEQEQAVIPEQVQAPTPVQEGEPVVPTAQEGETHAG